MKKTNIRRLTFVGSGNVATHLAQAFRMAGCEVVQVFSRQISHARQLAEKVGAEAIDTWDAIRCEEADAVVIALSDDALYSLPKNICFGNALVVHTSGTTPIGVLESVSTRFGVLWSPQTFIKDKPIDYSRLPFCIEANTDVVASEIQALARLVSPTTYLLTEEQRMWAHLASVFVSNFANALNAIGQEMMQAHGMDFAMLKPLMEATLQKTAHNDLWAQQTGPAIRHDQRTLDAHRGMLAALPKEKALYELFTQIIQSR